MAPNLIASTIDSAIVALLTGGGLPRPRIINIEPVSNLCQLRCPLCPTGIRMLDYPPTIMPLDLFKTILDKMPFINILELYRSGEPFLNPDLFAMIRYARDRNIKVVVSTHFSFSQPDDFFEQIATSGLEKLFVSLDGASQESYEQYRVGGSYDLVISNIAKLVKAKKKLSCAKPEIIWQFLVNKYNEHELAAAHRISHDLNISLDIRPMDLDDELPDMTLNATIEERMAHWLPENEHYIAERYRGDRRSPLFPGLCRDLFTRMVVTVDGDVMPCCMVWDHNNNFGNLLTDSFDDIWYSQQYRDARSHFLKEGHKPLITSICYRCGNFGASPLLRGKLNLLVTVYRKSLSLAGKKFLTKFM